MLLLPKVLFDSPMFYIEKKGDRRSARINHELLMKLKYKKEEMEAGTGDPGGTWKNWISVQGKD